VIGSPERVCCCGVERPQLAVVVFSGPRHRCGVAPRGGQQLGAAFIVADVPADAAPSAGPFGPTLNRAPRCNLSDHGRCHSARCRQTDVGLTHVVERRCHNNRPCGVWTECVPNVEGTLDAVTSIHIVLSSIELLFGIGEQCEQPVFLAGRGPGGAKGFEEPFRQVPGFHEETIPARRQRTQRRSRADSQSLARGCAAWYADTNCDRETWV